MDDESTGYVIGVDLDGVCADFYGAMREVVAEWYEVDRRTLTTNVAYGLHEWNVHDSDEYRSIHRFAVTRRDLFWSMPMIEGARSSLRRLSDAGHRIRIITYRLFIPYFHQQAIRQTVEWLDHHAIPYWDLCFMGDKAQVDAHIYVEDSVDQINALQSEGRTVIAFTNSTNTNMQPAPKLRANSWPEAEELINHEYKTWRAGHAGMPETTMPRPSGLEV